MRVQFLGWEDPLEEEMATHSSILAWKILWLEKAGELQSTGSQRIRYGLVTKYNQNVINKSRNFNIDKNII